MEWTNTLNAVHQYGQGRDGLKTLEITIFMEEVNKMNSS